MREREAVADSEQYHCKIERLSDQAPDERAKPSVFAEVRCNGPRAMARMLRGLADELDPPTPVKRRLSDSPQA